MVVVGGGKVAERKVRGLLEAGARVRVISPELTEGLRRLVQKGKIEHIGRDYQRGDLEGAFLAIAATSDMEINRAVSADATSIPVNVVDVPELCSFIVPATVKRGELCIAVSTSGASPKMAGSIREELEEMFKEEVAEFFSLLKELRERLKETALEPSAREGLFKELGSRRVLRVLLDAGMDEARKEIKRVLSKWGQDEIGKSL